MAPWLRSFDAKWLDALRRMPIEEFRLALNRESAHRGLVTGRGKLLTFVAQELLPKGTAYEAWIADTGGVPTRDNLHDRFNAMAWLSAPKTKAKLNALQALAMDQQSARKYRGRLRDATTIWDENLAVIAASGRIDELTHALASHDWPSLFGRMRSCWDTEWRVFVFGHALLEKLETPFKSITAHVVVAPMPSCDGLGWPELDARLVSLLHDAWAPSMFHHLPVLGIPGWHAANEDPHFYQDDQVFRPARR